MQADRATQREYGDDAAGARKHDEQASYRVPNVNVSVRLSQHRYKSSGLEFINIRFDSSRQPRCGKLRKFLWLKKEIENQSFQ
jgi:hypothetical protein